MKKHIKIKSSHLLLILALGLLYSCDDGFEELNKNIDLVTEPNLDYALPHLQLSMTDANYYTIADYVGAITFQVNRRKDFETLIRPGDTYHSHHFEWLYESPLKTASDIIEQTKDDPDKANYLSMARILKAYVVQNLTDSYGDVPYFEANKGYTERIFTPSYDPQKLIYEDLFKEVQEAVQDFDATKEIP